jgi:hypothetical protein
MNLSLEFYKPGSRAAAKLISNPWFDKNRWFAEKVVPGKIGFGIRQI